MSKKSDTEIKRELVSRREMLVGTGAAFATGVLVSTDASAATKKDLSAVASQNGVPLQDQVWDFEKKPEAIPDSKISETLTTDILIVGTGAAGMPCIASAIETGAKVIAIEKLKKSDCSNPSRPDRSRAIGAWFGFSGNRLYEKRGIKVDVERMVGDQVRSALWRCDQRQINKIFKEGPKVADWWLDILEEQGINPDSLPIETNAERNQAELSSQAAPRPGMYLYWYPAGVVLPAGRSEAALEKHINDNGFEITYETQAVYLLKDGHRVTGLIAKGPKGYIKINVTKAVILCTGGYEGNSEMIKKYIPEAEAIREVVGKKTNTGDGYLMAQWIGARMDPWPHCPMTWDGMNPEALAKFDMDYAGVSRQPWLYVNAFGQRFMNEDATFAGVGKSIYMQPKAMMWTVFDERWRNEDILEKLGGSVCRRMTTRRLPFILPMNLTETTEKMIAAGIILKADTLDELAAKMNQAGPALGIGADLDVNTFKTTVARYNEVAKSGHDSDFGKDPQMLFPCDKPPYYAIRTTYGILVTQAGALVDENFRVIDKEGKAFDGLYACGNVSGGFNAYECSMDVAMGSLGRSMVMGYLAAKHAAGEKI